MDRLVLTNILSSVVRSLTAGLVGLLVAYLVKFYFSDVRSYPPGPLPLPLIGNVLEFTRKGDRPPHRVLLDLKKRYGNIVTFWMAKEPQIIVADSKLAREALISYHFGGRPVFENLKHVFFPDNSIDIALADWGREWEVLRKVSHSAIRKFAVNENLPVMIHKSLQMFFEEIKRQNGDNAFDPEEPISLLMLSLISTINFGEHLTMDHPDFVEQNEAIKIQNDTNNKMFLINMLPFLKYLWAEQWRQVLWTIDVQHSYIRRKLKEHEASYDEGNIRDFTDALICARNEAEAENSPDLVYLKESNLMMAISDIYAAGSETTKMTLQWILLFMAAHPEHQKTVRDEVATAVGDREYPETNDRAKCPRLQAFISEVMRIRPIVPLSLPHKAIMDTELGGFKIKKNTVVIIPNETYLKDGEIWTEPEAFRPERFLTEEGKYNPKPNNYFLPFGAGRRVCLGEKLAITDVFLLVAGMLQQTRGKFFTVPGNIKDIDLSIDPHRDINSRPRPYKILLTRPHNNKA